MTLVFSLSRYEQLDLRTLIVWGQNDRPGHQGAIALKSIPVGTGYAVWTGIGAVGTAILGIVLFNEAATIARLACIGLIVAGIFGLKLVSGGD